MAVQNPSFEGPKTGSLLNEKSEAFEAENWTLVEENTAVEFAGYQLGLQVNAGESFEGGWDSNEDFAFFFYGQGYDLEKLVFNAGPDPSIAESFEINWDGNEDFQFVLVRTEECPFASGETFDDFESGWDNDSFVYAFETSDLVAASFSPEDFESSWGVDSYLFEFDDPGTQLEAYEIYFDESLEGYETFVEPVAYEYTVRVRGSINTNGADYIVVVNSSTVKYQNGSSDTQSDIAAALADRVDSIHGISAVQDGTIPARILIGMEDPRELLDPAFDLTVNAYVENNEGVDAYLETQWVGSWITGWPQSGIMRTIPIV